MRRFVHNPALVNASKYGKDFRKISPGMHNDGGTGKVTSMGLPKLSPATRMEYGVNGVGGLAGKQSFTCDFLIRKHPLKTLRRRQSEVSLLLSSQRHRLSLLFPNWWVKKKKEEEEEMNNWLARQLQAGQRLFAASIVRILCSAPFVYFELWMISLH